MDKDSSHNGGSRGNDDGMDVFLASSGNNNNNSNSSSNSRTIQVKIGSQPTKNMTPNQAASYLKSIASGGGGGKRGGAREVKMTLGQAFSTEFVAGSSASSGGSSSSNNIASGSAILNNSSILSAPSTTNSSSRGAPANLPAEFVDFCTMAASSSASLNGTVNTSGSSGSSSSSNNNGASIMPCSEKEMKALMSMFVEIMGLQIQTEHLSAYKPDGTPVAVPFPVGVTPPPEGWPLELLSVVRSQPAEYANAANKQNNGDETARNNYHGKTSESLPDLQPSEPRAIPTLEELAQKIAIQPPTPSYDITPMAKGIERVDWESLESWAMEDALEQEERNRKQRKHHEANNNNNSNNSSASAAASVLAGTNGFFTPDAVAAAASDVVHKRRKQQWATWRTKVTNAVQSNQTADLKRLLEAPPLTDGAGNDDSGVLVSDYYLPLRHLVLPKNRQSLEKHMEVRSALARHLGQNAPAVFVEPLQTGRSVWHQCSMDGDLALLRIIIEWCKKSKEVQLNQHCQDCGWSALHYAVLSGSVRTAEAVLGADPTLLTFETMVSHTWHKQTKKPFSPRALVQAVHTRLATTGKGKPRKLAVESYGRALQEMLEPYWNDCSSRNTRLLAMQLEQLDTRLGVAETKGYKPLTSAKLGQMEKKQREMLNEISAAAEVDNDSATKKTENSDTASTGANAAAATSTSKRKRKKKKGAASQQSSDAPPAAAAEPVVASAKIEEAPKEDPLTVALLGMGFEKAKIVAGIAACGGVQRATADDVVMHILGVEEDTAEEAPPVAVVAPSHNDKTVDSQDTAAHASSSEQPRGGSVSATSSSKETTTLNSSSQTAKGDGATATAAAEKLAAKREEQRRRNREWNNRQKQQYQQHQVPVPPLPTAAAAATGKPAPPPILAATAAAAPPSTPPVVAAEPVVSPSSGAAAVAPPQTSSWVHVNNSTAADQSHDASTVNSLNDIGTIEIITNDDATVSTMGSMPARATPAPPNPSSSTLAPPGFGLSVPSAVPEKQVMDLHNQQQQFHQQRHESILPQQQSNWNNTNLGDAGMSLQQRQGFSELNAQPEAPHLGVGGPSLLTQPPASMLGRQRSMPASNIHQPDVFSSLRASSTGAAMRDGNVGAPGIGDDPFAGDGGAGVPRSSAFNGETTPLDAAALFAPDSAQQTGFGRQGVGYGLGGGRKLGGGRLPGSGLGGIDFQADLSRRPLQQPHGTAMDSAIVDSISTGDAAVSMMLGGATLWGNEAQDTSAMPATSSLLQDLIGDTAKPSESETNSSLLAGLPAGAAPGNANWGASNTGSMRPTAGSQVNNGASIW